MGYALAEAAVWLGAEVVLVSGPTALSVPAGVEYVAVETTLEMYEEVKHRFGRTDCLIMAAAPADFTPANPQVRKIKKGEGGLDLELKPTVDILARLGKHKKHQVLVGFALETDNGVANARKKLKAKNLDLIILNSPSDPNSAFDFDTNKVTIIQPGKKPEDWPLMAKNDVATGLLSLISKLL
jgi:phosphopantothenoylcysteine decarboxylase / phosphopantothenate---cysteine ligase